jgi:multiple sugar transport system ATP-binding protein
VETGTIATRPRPDITTEKVVVGCRPESLSVDPAGTFSAVVSIVELLGSEVHVVARAGETRVVVRQDLGLPRPAIGETVRLFAEPGAIHFFDAASGVRLGDGHFEVTR